jgi:uncharacterized protein YraI
MVRLRPGYDPYGAASRYGLQVHIYRIPAGPAPAAIPHTPPTLVAGASAVVDAAGDCLNLRTSASTSASKIACLSGGTALKILGAPVSAGGMTWVQVQSPVGTGWVATQYLSAPPSGSSTPAAAATPAATPTPTPDATPTSTPDAAPSPDVAAAAAPTSDGGSALALARVDGSPGCLRMRSAASLSGDIQRCLSAATEVGLLPDDHVTADGYEWAHIRIDGSDGWVAAQYLIAE